MANNNFVVNGAQFTPLSFDEYYKPLAILNEQHQKLDDAYLELYTKASTIEQMANEQTDPEAYKQYKAYADDLRSAIETLDKNGLTPASRSQMLMMARRYGDEVAPIQGAYTRRAADITAQREALSKDQTIRFSRNAQDSSLMEYMKDPSLSYNQMSGAQITADVAAMVKNLKGQILAGGVTPWAKTLGGQQFERMISTGLSAEDIYNIMNNPEQYPQFTELIEQAVAASGVDSWGSDDLKAYARSQAYKGLWEGIGTDKIETVENKDLERAYKAASIARIKDEMNNPEKYGHKNTSKSSGSQEGRHYKELSNIVSRDEMNRYNTWDNDIKFVKKMQESNKALKPKDAERINQIAQSYGVDGIDKDGNMNYNALINKMSQQSGKRATPLYISNLTDETTLLTDMAYEALSGFHPKNGEVKAEDMDRLFPLENKSWKDVQLGKSNGVTKTYTDVLFDVMNDKKSSIMVDPRSGLLIVGSSLGNIMMYDKSVDNGTPRILNKQPFYIETPGEPLTYNFEQIMDSLNYLLTNDDYSDRDIFKITGKHKKDLTRDERDILDAYIAQYYNSLVNSLFDGLTDANNAVTPAHGGSSESANVYIPRP